MGDRGNIRLEYGEGYSPIFIYSHWEGTMLPLRVADALNTSHARKRWNDPAYLTRIIFDSLTEGDNPELNWGLAPYRPDEEHPDVVVNLEAQTVNELPYEDFIEFVRERYVKKYAGYI